MRFGKEDSLLPGVADPQNDESWALLSWLAHRRLLQASCMAKSKLSLKMRTLLSIPVLLTLALNSSASGSLKIIGKRTTCTPVTVFFSITSRHAVEKRLLRER